MADCYIVRRGGGQSIDKAAYSLPEFTYSGDYKLIDEGVEGKIQNWSIELYTSGNINFSKVVSDIEVFLVGGGSGGGPDGGGAGGGAGGYTKTSVFSGVKTGYDYEIVIGAGGSINTAGGDTSAFSFTANGGTRPEQKGANQGGAGGNGGSGGGGNGGSGGSNGSNGGGATSSYGLGQGTTTYAFGEETRKLFAGGGGSYPDGAGGAGGGGARGVAGTTNLGGGGGFKAKGGSGIVIIRNRREATA